MARKMTHRAGAETPSLAVEFAPAPVIVLQRKTR